MAASDVDRLLEAIRDLPREKQAEVSEFIERLKRAESPAPAPVAAALSEAAFRSVWDNPDDAAYDTL
jgi:hypothetical protein